MQTVEDWGGDADEAEVLLLGRALDLVMEGEGIEPGRIEASLSFVSPQRMRALNRRSRGVDRATDVLSFPQYPDLPSMRRALGKLPEGMPLALGDVVICRGKVISQAKSFGHSEGRELAYLFVHSLLHLLGYDHEPEDARRTMRSKEEEIMKKLGLERGE